MEVLIVKTLTALLMPPGLMLLLMLGGMIYILRNYRVGRNLIISGFILLFIASMRLFPAMIIPLLEATPALTPQQLSRPEAQAIVVLGGGRYADAPEYGGDTVGRHTLERLRYGAYLHAETQLPMLVTGGSPYGRSISEAELMQQTLQKSFKLQARWVEKASDNTWANAALSFKLLQPAGIKRIYLVTHAWHIPRAQVVFEKAGFEVVPAPMGYEKTADHPWLFDVLPTSAGLSNSRLVIHELLGRIWYALRY